MKRNHLCVMLITVAMCGAAGAEPASDGLILRHDYFAGSGADLTGGGRDGVTGTGAVQMPRFVHLSGDRDSAVRFASIGPDGQTLEQIVAQSGGDATIELWFEGRDLERGDFLLLDSRSRAPDAGADGPARGTTFRLEVPVRRADASMVIPDGQGQTVDVINGASATGALSSVDTPGKININRLHQYVYVFDGNQPIGDGHWKLYIDGGPDPLIRSFYRTSTGRNVFSLQDDRAGVSVGGKQSDLFNQHAPKGKLHRLLIYNRALDAARIAANYKAGLLSIRAPTSASPRVTPAGVGPIKRRGQALILIDQGKAHAVIVVADQPTQDVIDAAQGLQGTLMKMTGVRLPVQSESLFAGRAAAILLGPSKLADSKHVRVRQDRDSEGDHYVIKTGKDYLALIGNGDGELRGTSYAAYDLLQRLGCGWFGPDPVWHVIPRPRNRTIAVGNLDVDERPAFASRALSLAYHHRTLRYAWRLGGYTLPVGDAMNQLILGDVARVDYKKTHPGIFKGNARQPCYTSPQVIAIVADKLREKMDRQAPNLVRMTICPNDNDAFCPCQRCAAEGNRSAQVLYFANQVAAELDKTHPRKFELTFLAYWPTHSPPAPMRKAHPAVTALQVNAGNHTVPWDQPEPADIRPYGPRNPREIQAFQGWRKTGAMRGIYEWWIPACSNSDWAYVPWYSGDTALRNLRYWKRHGVRYVYYENGYELGTGFPVRWPLFYVAARGLWDTELTSERIMTEACDKLYEDAAEPMLGFYRLLEHAMLNCGIGAKTWSLPGPERIYTPDIVKRATALLNDALAKAKTQEVRARIEDERRMWTVASATMARIREKAAGNE